MTTLLLMFVLAQESKHGGKLPWIKDYEKGTQERKDTGGGAIVYFTKDGWEPCSRLDAGPFSSEKFAELVKDATIILVDISIGDANKKTADAFEIKGYPTILFLDDKGERVDQQVGVGGDDALADKFKKHIEKYPRTGWGTSITDALSAAKEAGCPALYLFLDESDKSKAAMAALRDESVAETLAKFKKARYVFAGDEKAFKAEMKAFKVTQVPCLLVLDPNADKPLKAIAALSKPKEIKKALDEALKKLAGE